MPWGLAETIVTVLKAGIPLFMEPPLSYMVIVTFVLTGLYFFVDLVFDRGGD